MSTCETAKTVVVRADSSPLSTFLRLIKIAFGRQKLAAILDEVGGNIVRFEGEKTKSGKPVVRFYPSDQLIKLASAIA